MTAGAVATSLAAVRTERLRVEQASFAAQFAKDGPFPHLVIDDFLEPEAAADLATQFPTGQVGNETYVGLVEDRQFLRSESQMPSAIRAIFAELRSPEFVAWLEATTGYRELIPDFENIESGLITTKNGGYHGLHVDPNMHPSKDWYRRITLLIYVNREWDDAWGGDLELWDAGLRKVRKSVPPTFNRCFVFGCRDRSWHGYQPLHMPADKARRVLLLVYYAPTAGPGQSSTRYPTTFGVRPDEPLRKRLGFLVHQTATHSPLWLRLAVRPFVGAVRRAGLIRIGRQ